MRFFTKQKVKILKVARRLPGQRHYLCETNVGVLRKPAGSIPKDLMRGWVERREREALRLFGELAMTEGITPLVSLLSRKGAVKV